MTRLPDLRSVARALGAAGLALAALAAAPARAATITLSDSATSVASQTVCPRANGSAVDAVAAVPVNAFQLAADTGTARIDRVFLRFVPADSYANVERVEIRSADRQTLYGATVPGAENVSVSLSLPLPVTTTPTTYLVTITPRQHQGMPPPSAGGAVATQIQVTQVYTYDYTNPVTGNDLASATVTVDNGSPANPVWSGITASASSILLDWAGAPDPTVLVLRREYGPVQDVPAEGASYAVGAFPGGSSQVVYAQQGPQFTDAGLTAGRPYYYRVFTVDACNNYSIGTSLGPIFPGGSGEGDLTANSTKPVVGILNPVSGPVTRPFKVQIRVFSPGNVAISEVRLYGNNGAGDVLLGTSTGTSPAITRNASYDAGTATPSSGIYELTADTTRLSATGTWTLRAWAANGGTGLATSAGTYSGGVGVIVGSDLGDGRLLVRDNSSQLCSDCHAAKTHSSETTGNGLGAWYVGCRGCHAPHGTTNAKLIAKEITPPAVNGAQAPQPVYFTGADGNVAGGKANPDGTGLCQVCHTRTQYYTRGATNQTHGGGAACGDCHRHADGMNASCTNCHGDAARTLVAGADALAAAAPPVAASPVGANDVGAHQAHVNRATLRRAPLACAECHTMPNAHDGRADTLTFGRLAATGGGTPLWTPAASTCASVYCHGGPAAAQYGGADMTPSWLSSTALTCGSCHGAPPTTTISDGSTHPADSACDGCHGTGYRLAGITGAALDTHIDGTLQAQACTGCHGTAGVNAAPPARATPATTSATPVGKHQVHVTSTRLRSAALACSECHASYPTGHRDGTGTVAFGTLATTGARTPSYNRTTPACSGTYCHAAIPGGSAQTPNWASGAAMTCGSCHGAPPPISAHHPQNTASGCSACHGAGYATTGLSGAALTRHLDGTVEPRTGCTACHGDLSVASATATNPAAAPGYNGVGVDAQGNTTVAVRTVGAHDAHVRGTNFRPAALPCSECHAGNVPADGDVSHANGTVAPLAGGALATSTGLATTPALTWNGTTCANTYCHGNFKNGKNATVTWAQHVALDCNSCHGRGTGAAATPPGGTHVNRTDCASCHPDYTVAANRGTHLDGRLDTVNVTCTTCHGTANRAANAGIAGAADANLPAAPPVDSTNAASTPAVGPHLAHVNPAASGQTYLPIPCSECHGAVSGYTNSHPNGTMDVVWSSARVANLGGATPTWTAGTPDPRANAGSCNTYCHGATLPSAARGTVTQGGAWSWNTGTTAACGSCHGLPPDPAGTHAGVQAAATDCNRCHGETVNAQGAIIFTGTGASATTKHINGVVDGGESSGGLACTGCHASIYNSMASGGLHRHAMTSATAPGTAGSTTVGTYSTTTTAATCTQCHLDHNLFRPTVNTAGSRAKNLRLSATAQPTASNGQATDHSGGTGVCASCHQSALTKAAGLPDAGATTPAINGTAFSASAHDYASFNPTSAFSDRSIFAANCSKCHQSEPAQASKQTSTQKFDLHASTVSSLTDPLGAATVAQLEERFCYRCHSHATDAIGGTRKAKDGRDVYDAKAVSAAAEAVYGDMQKAYGHKVGSYSGLHRPNPADETRTYLGTAANKHVECGDCHDPHAAKAGARSGATLAPALTGATGVTVTTWGANWAGVTTWAQGTTAALPDATAEWQLCFKCHSSANGNWAGMGGTAAAAFTDLALEFNPNNNSYHPVIQALPSTGNRRLATGALTGGWTPGAVMTCSDCHGTDTAGAHGPHGSAVKWMLSPNTTATKYTNWPYTTAAGNGGSTGTLVRGTGTTTAPSGGVFCLSCHTWAGGGAAHTQRGTSHGLACVGCHIRVPHGARTVRLLTGPNAPARYKPDGNGGGTIEVNGATLPASGTIGSSNCYSSSCTQHRRVTGQPVW
jgi:predicted CxxxxCH...CXXCH cytochrome family protein